MTKRGHGYVVRGHKLLREPNSQSPARFDDRGRQYLDPLTEIPRKRRGRGRCECGALSEPGLTNYSIQQWHREHREGVRP